MRLHQSGKMEDNDDLAEYYGVFPPERKYPPIIPDELTSCLKNASRMVEECTKLKKTLGKAIVNVKAAKKTLSETGI